MGQRHAHPVIDIRQKGGTDRFQVNQGRVWSGPVGRNVQAQREAQILGRGPQRLVLGGIVAMLLQRVDRDHCTAQPQLGAAFQLSDTLRDIVNIQHGDTLDPLREGLAELGQPVVIGPAQDGQERTIRDAVQQQSLSRIEHVGINAIQVQVFEMFLGDIGSGSDVFHFVTKRERVPLLGHEALAGL